MELLYVAVKVKQLSSYFYQTKEEFDFIPEIIDYISHESFVLIFQSFAENLVSIFIIFNSPLLSLIITFFLFYFFYFFHLNYY